MVEQRRLPSGSVMTVGAGRDSGPRKLQAMDIRVARLACLRRRLEIYMHQPGSGVRRLMAIGTLSGFVGSNQWKGGSRMIVAGEFSPGLGGMADFTSERRSIRRRPPHESVKLPFMWICVTSLACHALPVILRGWFRFEIRRLLVTVAAWNRHVTATQTKGNFVVSAQPECGW